MSGEARVRATRDASQYVSQQQASPYTRMSSILRCRPVIRFVADVLITTPIYATFTNTLDARFAAADQTPPPPPAACPPLIAQHTRRRRHAAAIPLPVVRRRYRRHRYAHATAAYRRRIFAIIDCSLSINGERCCHYAI